MVVPSRSLRLALGVICGPILAGFMEARSKAKGLAQATVSP